MYALWFFHLSLRCSCFISANQFFILFFVIFVSIVQCIFVVFIALYQWVTISSFFCLKRIIILWAQLVVGRLTQSHSARRRFECISFILFAAIDDYYYILRRRRRKEKNIITIITTLKIQWNAFEPMDGCMLLRLRAWCIYAYVVASATCYCMGKVYYVMYTMPMHSNNTTVSHRHHHIPSHTKQMYSVLISTLSQSK